MIDTFYSLDIEHGYPLGKFCHIPPENLEPENHRLKSTLWEGDMLVPKMALRKSYISPSTKTCLGAKNTPSLISWSFVKKFEVMSTSTF